MQTSCRPRHHHGAIARNPGVACSHRLADDGPFNSCSRVYTPRNSKLPLQQQQLGSRRTLRPLKPVKHARAPFLPVDAATARQIASSAEGVRRGDAEQGRPARHGVVSSRPPHIDQQDRLQHVPYAIPQRCGTRDGPVKPAAAARHQQEHQRIASSIFNTVELRLEDAAQLAIAASSCMYCTASRPAGAVVYCAPCLLEPSGARLSGRAGRFRYPQGSPAGRQDAVLVVAAAASRVQAAECPARTQVAGSGESAALLQLSSAQPSPPMPMAVPAPQSEPLRRERARRRAPRETESRAVTEGPPMAATSGGQQRAAAPTAGRVFILQFPDCHRRPQVSARSRPFSVERPARALDRSSSAFCSKLRAPHQTNPKWLVPQGTRREASGRVRPEQAAGGEGEQADAVPGLHVEPAVVGHGGGRHPVDRAAGLRRLRADHVPAAAERVHRLLRGGAGRRRRVCADGPAGSGGEGVP
ncbi:hypothetical protein ON010_g6314 [Phytophthora cinnamomi]|nr:hypothetical protein ON010_g6314 [Phytophthora cinnamomi]